MALRSPLGVVCLVALAVVTTARASRPPTPAQLFVGLVTTTTVPGLEHPVPPYHYAHHGLRPTARECIALWNTSVPSATRPWIIGHSSTRRADVTVHVSEGRVIGSTTKFTDFNCAFAVSVAPKAILYVEAPPKGSTGRWSGMLLHYRAAATAASLTRRFNAAVNSAGALRLT